MHNHGEGFKGGEKCKKCSRIIIEVECCVCDGTGKPQNPGWARIRSTCPRCEGNGHSHMCPIGKHTWLSEGFGGISCDDITDGEDGNFYKPDGSLWMYGEGNVPPEVSRKELGQYNEIFGENG